MLSPYLPHIYIAYNFSNQCLPTARQVRLDVGKNELLYNTSHSMRIINDVAPPISFAKVDDEHARMKGFLLYTASGRCYIVVI